jgi:thioredoxin-like negative regulator of GroEL
MVANSYSKAVLRAAIEETVTKFEFAEYFPSFESVVGSDRSRAWQNDLVHVQRELIDEIVDRMLESYAEDPVSVPVGIADTPEKLTRQLNEAPARAVREIAENLSQIAGQEQLIQLFVKACLRLRKPNEAKAALALVVDLDEKPDFLLLGARVAMLEKNFGVARLRLESLENTSLSMRPEYWKLLLEACFAEGQVGAAVAAVDRSKKFLPRSPIIYHAAAVGLAKVGDVTRAEFLFKDALNRANSWPRLWIDYADFLFTVGKGAEAREIVAQIVPTHQSHRIQLAEMARRFGL